MELSNFYPHIRPPIKPHYTLYTSGTTGLPKVRVLPRDKVHNMLNKRIDNLPTLCVCVCVCHGYFLGYSPRHRWLRDGVEMVHVEILRLR
jgi:hypothetical protein